MFSIFIGSENLVLTAGATHGLHLLASLFLRTGTPIFVEDPTYFLAFTMLRDDFGMNIIPGVCVRAVCKVTHSIIQYPYYENLHLFHLGLGLLITILILRDFELLNDEQNQAHYICRVLNFENPTINTSSTYNNNKKI